jgi:hypothetical protein
VLVTGWKSQQCRGNEVERLCVVDNCRCRPIALASAWVVACWSSSSIIGTPRRVVRVGIAAGEKAAKTGDKTCWNRLPFHRHTLWHNNLVTVKSRPKEATSNLLPPRHLSIKTSGLCASSRFCSAIFISYTVTSFQLPLPLRFSSARAHSDKNETCQSCGMDRTKTNSLIEYGRCG